MSEIYVIKKSGVKELFNPEKIYSAVKKSAERVLTNLSTEDLQKISEKVLSHLNGVSEVKVSDLHNIVEVSLDELKLKKVARSYKEYRNYKLSFIKIMNEVDKKAFSLRYLADKSNANADSTLVATKRSLVYQEYSSGMYKRFFLSEDELAAMTDGYIYIHDRGSRLDATHNCMLFDAGRVMKGGFEFGNLHYTEPTSVAAAMDVLWDITMNAASMQYGGITVYLDEVLHPYVLKSYDKYMDEYTKLAESMGTKVDPTKAEDWVEKKIARDLEQGLQAMEHKFSSMSSSRGDYPFTTMAIYGGTDRWRKLIVKSALKVRMGGQGLPGFKRPVLFPKLVFLYDENIHGVGKESEDLFKLATKCSRKAQYPDMLSLTGNPENNHVADMWLRYGTPILPMG